MMPLLQERMEHKQREKLRRFNWDLEVSRTRWHDFQFERHDVYNLWLLTNINLIVCLYIFIYIHTHTFWHEENISKWMNYGKLFGGFVGNGVVAPFLLGTCWVDDGEEFPTFLHELWLWRLVEKSELRNQGKMPLLGSQIILNFNGNVPSGKVKVMNKKSILQNRLWIFCFRDFSRVYLDQFVREVDSVGGKTVMLSVLCFFFGISWKSGAVWGGWKRLAILWGVMVWWRAWALPVWEA